MREAGVLLHLTALPGPYGCGTMGRYAIRFAEALAGCGFRVWQMLPVNPVGDGNSPYSSPAAFAGNLFLIDPEQLVDMGLLGERELSSWECDSPHRVDFDFLRSTRIKLLRAVFEQAGSLFLPERAAFSERESFWLEDYARYQTENKGECPEFWRFAQWLFDEQWRVFKAAVNKTGLEILGDMPIYVAASSADFAANPQLFLRDEKGLPSPVAAVPPDYFSPLGQLWGNPLYDWQAHRAQGFAWWRARAARVLSLFDRVRLDHFRGLSAYYAVPRGAVDATKGAWCKGPGMELLGALFSDFGAERWLAEDLGELDDDVRRLLRESGLPGMRVLQFAFDGNGENPHLPHNYTQGCAAYTGTHDNNTLIGYLWEASESERERALAYLEPCGDWGQGGAAAPAVWAALRTLWQSPASNCIVPLQDLLGYGADTRMNTPGIAEGNWGFRVTQEQLEQLDTARLRALNLRYGRLAL
ncbi:MAG: 4-alpha-glucanotransferase [Clostridium sp.]|jgi:4-alpha-glucanotransferase|nr:4-alpha-glucanotransferase [Clostridium sp.]